MFIVYANYSHMDILNLDYIENIEVTFSKSDSSVIAWGPSSNFEDNEDRSQYVIANGDFEECYKISNAILSAMGNKENIIDIRSFYKCEEEE